MFVTIAPQSSATLPLNPYPRGARGKKSIAILQKPTAIRTSKAAARLFAAPPRDHSAHRPEAQSTPPVKATLAHPLIPGGQSQRAGGNRDHAESEP